MTRPALLLLPLVLAACDMPPMDPVRAADICEERARAAQGPTGSVTVGINSNSGIRNEAGIAISSDWLQGRDPQAVYEDCVRSHTGQGPIRPAGLRGL